MTDEILFFYPVLMPFFIKCDIDGGLAGASLYFGSVVGKMFSIVNPLAVGIASYSAGINFIDGIVLRVIGFILVDAIVIGYFIFYNIRVKKNPIKSAVYDIKDELFEKYSKYKNVQNDNNIVEIMNQDDFLKKENEVPTKFTIIQKICLILFGLTFVIMIIGVSVFRFGFEQLAIIFSVLGIILLFFARKGEVKGIEIFVKGAGDFIGIMIIIGIARGINITIDKELIADTLLNGLSKLVDGLPKVLFAVITYFVFIILGIFIQSSSGLAVLSMPVFAPLADNVNCSKTVVVNYYMFGQNLISFVTPTGLTLIVLQLVGLKYKHWFKFIGIFTLVLFFYLLIIIIINSLVD